MTIPSTNKKPSLIQIVIGLAAGAGLVVMAYSPQGEELYADVWLRVILPFFLLGIYIFAITTTWKKIDKNRKLIILLMIGLSAWLALSSLSLHWKDLPWGRRGAMETANRFMTDLKHADYPAAFEKLSPVTQSYMTPQSLGQPNARPVSWHLETMNRDSEIFGAATFSDGVELPVEIRMRWLNYNWKIIGAQFGEWKENTNGSIEVTPRLDFMFCCDSYGFLFDTFLSWIDGSEPVGWNVSP